MKKITLITACFLITTLIKAQVPNDLRNLIIPYKNQVVELLKANSNTITKDDGSAVVNFGKLLASQNNYMLLGPLADGDYLFTFYIPDLQNPKKPKIAISYLASLKRTNTGFALTYTSNAGETNIIQGTDIDNNLIMLTKGKGDFFEDLTLTGTTYRTAASLPAQSLGNITMTLQNGSKVPFGNYSLIYQLPISMFAGGSNAKGAGRRGTTIVPGGSVSTTANPGTSQATTGSNGTSAVPANPGTPQGTTGSNGTSAVPATPVNTTNVSSPTNNAIFNGTIFTSDNDVIEFVIEQGKGSNTNAIDFVLESGINITWEKNIWFRSNAYIPYISVRDSKKIASISVPSSEINSAFRFEFRKQKFLGIDYWTVYQNSLLLFGNNLTLGSKITFRWVKD